MFARVAGISAPGASPDQGVAFFRDLVPPDLRQYRGFEGAMVLVSREGEDVLVISLWDIEEHLLQAEATPAPHRTSAAREALGPRTQRNVRIYEVALRA